MTATYTFDVFASLDGHASYDPPGDWGGYWGKQGPELLERRQRVYDGEQRMVLGATTFGQFVQMIGGASEGDDVLDPWVTRMRSLPAYVVSSTLTGEQDWPDATVLAGDAVELVAALKEESDVPLRSHGSLSLNRALMAAGLVDLVQLTVFPVISGESGVEPVLGGRDYDLDLVDSRTLDGRTVELTYRPHLHVWA